MIFSPTICLAKSIKIDDISYDVLDVLETDTYTYYATSNTLILRNANLKRIETVYDLNIILEGNNYIINDNKSSDSIKAGKIEISGNGSLTIDSKKRGIVGEKVLINNTTLDIKSIDDAIYSYSSSRYDIIVNNSNIEIETNKTAFNPIIGDLYLNNSSVNIIKALEFISNMGLYTYINNTCLNVFEVETVNTTGNYIFVNDFSDVKIHTTNNKFLSVNYILDNNLEILGSLDDISYQEITSTSLDKYIKISNTLDTNILKEKKKELLELENELNKLEKSLIIKEEDLLEKEKSLKNKEEELVNLEEEIKLKESKINHDKEDIESIINKLKKKEGEVKILEEDLLKEIENLAKLKTSLDGKEEELKELEISLKKEFERKECEYVSKDNILSNKESINNIENPKTFDKLLVDMGSLIISFLGIITLIFVKKKGWLDG